MHFVYSSADGQLNIGRIRARGQNFRHRHIRLMPMIAALWATEATQMAVGDIVVLIFGLAVNAIGRIRQLVRRIFINRNVNAKPQHLVGDFLRKRGGQRTVRVEAQRRVRHMGDALADGV